MTFRLTLCVVASFLAVGSTVSPPCTKTAPGMRCAGAEGYEYVPWAGGCCVGECAPDTTKGYGRWCPDAEEEAANDPVQVFNAHISALNACDVDALVDLRSKDFMFFLPRGSIVRGKAEARAFFAGACLSFEEGGFRGWTFTAENTQLVGNVYNVQWVMRSSFAEDYRGADAYVSRGGKMASMVSTFDADEIVYTRRRSEGGR